MRRKIDFRPSLEVLEDRWVPATIRFAGGILQVSNPTPSLDLTLTANNVINVVDNGKNNGTFAGVRMVLIRGTNQSNTINFDVSSFTFGGSLLINSGNGNDTINISGAGGRIGGNITLLSGRGTDTINLSNMGTGALTVGGNITMFDQAGNDVAYLGDGAGILTVGRNVTMTGINAIRVSADENHFFGGNFTVSLGTDTGTAINFPTDPPNVPDNMGMNFQLIDVNGSLTELDGKLVTIGGSLTLTGGVRDDGVLLGFVDIGGNLVVSLKGSVSEFGNDLSIADAGSGTTTVFGNLLYSGGSGVDFVDLGNAVILGNANIDMGTGDDGIALDDLYPDTTPGIAHTEIGGNLIIRADSLQTTVVGNGIQALIGGDLILYLGNGNSSIIFEDGPLDGQGASIGGTVRIYAGNGDNEIIFQASFGVVFFPTYQLDLRLGNGDNTLVLDNPSATFTGSVVFGSGFNSLMQLAGTVADPFTIQFG